MNINSLKPAKDFAEQFGIKALIFGPAGSAKTPLLNTAPRPLLLATEPGLLSMRGSNIPTWEAYTPARINEFFRGSFPVTKLKTLIHLVLIAQVKLQIFS